MEAGASSFYISNTGKKYDRILYKTGKALMNIRTLPGILPIMKNNEIEYSATI
jgi:hypothetical protein